MPWTPEDAAAKTKKANTPRKRRQWARIANSALARGESDAAAIKQANGVIARESRPGQHEFSADEERAMRRSARRHR